MRVLFLIGGYLLGSISFSILVVRLRTGRDIRREGSGNAGATNVARTLGLPAALAVGLADVAKGAGAVFLMSLATANPGWLGAAAVSAVVGHVFPIWFGFRGGKGVATFLGAFLALTPVPTLCVLGVFLAIVLLTRYVSLASILAAVALPPASLFLFRVPDAVALSQGAAALLIVFRHLGNLRRLAAGTERKLGRR